MPTRSEPNAGQRVGLRVTRRDVDRDVSAVAAGSCRPTTTPRRCRGAESRSGVPTMRLLDRCGIAPGFRVRPCRRPPWCSQSSDQKLPPSPDMSSLSLICTLPDGRARRRTSARSTSGSGDLEPERDDLRRALIDDGELHRQPLPRAFFFGTAMLQPPYRPGELLGTELRRRNSSRQKGSLVVGRPGQLQPDRNNDELLARTDPPTALSGRRPNDPRAVRFEPVVVRTVVRRLSDVMVGTGRTSRPTKFSAEVFRARSG